MIKGLLDSKGVYIREGKVAQSLKRVDPQAYTRRSNNTVDRTNPVPYHASGFGHKLHLDQNEKLVMFGVTHVLAVDGYSGMIVSHVIMPVKNNLLIYEHIYRKSVLTYGLWEQIRVDCGREFFLTLFIQKKLRQQYGSTEIVPYVQTPSTQNLTVERLWPQVNARVNYPLKRILFSMQDRNSIDMTCPTTRYCVSHVVIKLATVGMERFISAWNSHFIAGKGVPLVLSQQRFTTQVQASVVPSTVTATQDYEQQGGSLTHFSEFGIDPLRERHDLIRLRDEHFGVDIGSYETVFTDAVSGSGDLVERALLHFLTLTQRLAQLI
ncbi:PREDICTED: uncharacterized protein LOC109589282 [Amphimedon queenslandica]|uniref:Integrase core domain-containing protein n=1 Tax=Amphimedon queenslandica TaxID=400682 RepID=A0AAN0JVL6_AMPQE|nr:PREDICTED: uncharacterized protein LOC109589282 [Amphimedon queenslandica]|eukprot:XP_019860944.1 PREDICTED: uncharacterized protein LOC109589282 [Amphimedon queenslandica]